MRIRVDARFRRQRSVGPDGELGMRRRDERQALDGTRITKAGAEDPGAGLGRAGRSGSSQCDPDRNGTARTSAAAR